MVAKANNLDVELVETAGGAVDKKVNPQGKVPTFVGTNGFVLSEAIAIAVYRESLPLFSFPPPLI